MGIGFRGEHHIFVDSGPDSTLVAQLRAPVQGIAASLVSMFLKTTWETVNLCPDGKPLGYSVIEELPRFENSRNVEMSA